MKIEDTKNCIKISEDKVQLDWILTKDIADEFVELKLISTDKSFITELFKTKLFSSLFVEFFEFVEFVKKNFNKFVVVVEFGVLTKKLVSATKLFDEVDAKLEMDSVVNSEMEVYVELDVEIISLEWILSSKDLIINFI